MLATIWNSATYQGAHTLVLCLLFGWLGCCVAMTINACRRRTVKLAEAGEDTVLTASPPQIPVMVAPPIHSEGYPSHVGG